MGGPGCRNLIDWKEIYFEENRGGHSLYLVGTAVLLIWIYLAFVAKIAPYHVDRYVFCIYPFVSLVLTYLIFRVLQEFKLPVLVCQAVVWILFLFLTGKGIYENRIQYIYPETAPNIELARGHSGEDCIYVTDNDGAYLLVGNALELQHMGWVLVLPPDYLSALPKIVNESADEMVVYVDERYNPDEIMTQFCQNSGFQTYEPLFVSRCYAYVVKRQ